MQLSFTKTIVTKRSYPEKKENHEYVIYKNGVAIAEMQFEPYVNSTMLVAGKLYKIMPVLRFFTISKYLVISDGVEVAKISIPPLLLKKVSIEIYGGETFEISRSEILQHRWSFTTPCCELNYASMPQENNLLIALFVFLTELIQWQENMG